MLTDLIINDKDYCNWKEGKDASWGETESFKVERKANTIP